MMSETNNPANMTSPERHLEIEQLLYREARFLDERDYDAWLSLWTEDCRYFVPVRNTIASKPGKPVRPIADELETDLGAAWIDDRKELMMARVARLKTGKAWSENPPARTRRFVSNIEISAVHEDGAIEVCSNLLQHRNRRDNQVDWFSCQRRDVITTADAALLFRSRTVILDSDVLNASYVTFF